MNDTGTAAVMNPAGQAAREPIPYRALLPSFALAFGIAVSLLSKSGWDRYILPLEVFADAFIVFFALRLRSAGARWWRVAAAALLAGDTFYLAGHLVPAFPAWAFMTQEACYTLSRFMTAAYLFANLPRSRELAAAEKAILAGLAALSVFISVQYLILPYSRSDNHPELFFRVNAVLNRLAEAGVFPLALLLGMKARTKYWLYLTHGIALVSIASIAIGYYIAINAVTTGIPVQEYGWLFGLLVILISQAYDPSAPSPFARWNGARVRLVWLVLVFNLALLSGLYFLRTFISKDAFELASILFVFFGLWLVANLIAFRISADLNLLLGNVGAEAPAPALRVAIYEAELFAEKLKAAYDTIRSQARLSALSSLAAQVAHDIRSPLAALDTALKDVSQLPEEQRQLISAAAGRIRDIANDLLEKNRPGAAVPGPGALPEPGPLLPLIEAVLAEKRLQYRGRPGTSFELAAGPVAGALRARVDPVEFGRLLSNLVNNSVEALEGGGKVSVSLVRNGAAAEITVRDDGKGIPAEVLDRLGRRGGTYGKSGGSGLGLYHARSSAEAWGGALSISSEPGKGTAVVLTLPLAGTAD